MGDRLPHRGSSMLAWSPAPEVYFGCRGSAPACIDGQLAADAQLDEQSIGDVTSALRRGFEALKNINGYFSLAFWDESRHEVVLACDTSGFKSLYYMPLEGRVAFASEYKALLALTDVRAELNLDAAQHYLCTNSFFMDRPLLRGVRTLAAGAALSIRGRETLPRSYWLGTSKVENRSRSSFAREVRATLEHVVTRQASRFSRAAILLSGGLDSACVLALLRQQRPDLQLSSYTIGFGHGDPEIQGGRELAEKFGTQHCEITFDPELIRTHLPVLVWLMEDCAGGEESLLQHLVLSEACRHERVVFGGHGADTLFAGMPRYRLIRMRDAMPWLHTPVSELFQMTQMGTAPHSLLGRLGEWVLNRGDRWPPPAVIGTRWTRASSEDLRLDEFIASRMTEAQDSGYIEPTLEQAAVEFRDPFQSTEMMELALKIPGHYNVGFLRQKMILRRAVADLVPDSIRRRPKSFQRFRYDLQISDIFDDFAGKILTEEAVLARGVVSPDYVRKLRNRHASQPYTRHRLSRLWALVCLELWQSQFIDNRARIAPRHFLASL